MAYDPKDPADKKIVDDLIAAAVLEVETEHEVNIAGLKKKNSQLMGKLQEGKFTEGMTPVDFERLETQLQTAANDLKVANKTLKDVTKERDGYKTSSEQESAFAKKLLVDNGLNEALISNNVGRQFLPAVRRLLAEKVEIKVEGENRTALVDGKPLGEFVKAWSQGDEGKHYVIAPTNGGGGAPGGQQGGQSKKFGELSEPERVKLWRENPTEFERQKSVG